VQLNTGAAEVAESFVVTGLPTPLVLQVAGGPRVVVRGTDVELRVLGQVLRGDVDVVRSVDSAGAVVVDVVARNLQLRLGGSDASPVVTATQTAGPATLRLGPPDWPARWP
jgi:hypothetical protein